MALEMWEAAVGAAGTLAAGGTVGFFGRRSRGERDATSAKVLAEAYGLLVDDQRKDIEDAREHTRRQDKELSELRAELRTIREARDGEMNALRSELATVRAELLVERQDNRLLRDRIAALEAGRRSTDPTA